MCDTVVVTPEASADGSLLLAKNSDREPEEAQALELVTAAEHAPDSICRCSYVDVPQVARTHAVLLSRPFWMWGAEMGANDQGLVIGNEAVFTRVEQQEVGLLGMDLLRLTLERAGSAAAGVTVLTDLLGEHGQGGAAGYRNKSFRYHNSFLLADPAEAWVVETAGRAWVADRVVGVRAISNGLTIRDRYARSSSGLAAFARDRRLHSGKGPVDFRASFADRAMGFAAAADERRGCVEAFMRRAPATVARAMACLRQHGAVKPGAGLRQSVCGHASWLPTRRAGQTTNSWVSQLGADLPCHFATATSAACLSSFKPLWLDGGLPGYGALPGARFSQGSLWWRHERLHRRALTNLEGFLAGFGPERDALERRLISERADVGSAAGRQQLTALGFEQGELLASEWLRRPLLTSSASRRYSGLQARFWRALDRRCGM